MAEYEISFENSSGITIQFGATGVTAIRQNVAMIIASVVYSCPMNRDFALDGSLVDRPIPVQQMLLKSRITEAVKKYEPRATITSIIFSGEGVNGLLKPKVKVRINDG